MPARWEEKSAASMIAGKQARMNLRLMKSFSFKPRECTDQAHRYSKRG
jgi:hypothetical protein